MKPFTKFCREQGYSINREFSGHPKNKLVVRFRGEFVSSEKNKKEAELTIIFHSSDRTEKLTGIKLI